MDSYNSGPYGSGQYYCGGCGLLRPLLGKCPECVRRDHMKNVEASMERQRVDMERNRIDREREFEKQQYYARINSPEYQAQKALERQREQEEELDRLWRIAEAERIEQERWNSLTAEEQAAEIELKNKRRELSDAKISLDREIYQRSQKSSKNVRSFVNLLLWGGYATGVIWVFISLLPAMFRSLTLLAFPLGAMVILITGLIGMYLLVFSSNE